MTYKIEFGDGRTAEAHNIVGAVEVELHKDYNPGQKGNPTTEQIGDAVRRELSDFLNPGHPIIIRQAERVEK